MLFVIDQSVADAFAIFAPVAKDIVGLNFLAQASGEGKHRIGGSRRILTSLSVSPALQEYTRRILSRAVGRATQEGRLHNGLAVYGRVIVTNAASPTSEMVGHQRVITFPLHWFDDSAKIQACTLLGENLDDANVLIRMGEAGAHLAREPYLPLKCYSDHAGGNPAQVLQSHADHSRLCFCVVDSDRACPAGKLGGTATSAQPFKASGTYPLLGVTETSGRDLENALPDTFYQSAFGSAPLTAVLKELTHQREFEIRAHIDIEHGMPLSRVFDHPIGCSERTFWDAKLPAVANLAGINMSTLSCLTTGSCSAVAKKPPLRCSCVVVGGNTAKILRAFLDRFKTPTRYQLAESLDDSVRDEWRRIGIMVASWCCADEPLRQ